MYFVHGLVDGSASEARRLYRERYPRRRRPDRRAFEWIHRRLCEHESFAPRRGNKGRQRSTTPGDEETILDVVEQNPGISTRLLGMQVCFSHDCLETVCENYSCIHIICSVYRPCHLRIFLHETNAILVAAFMSHSIVDYVHQQRARHNIIYFCTSGFRASA
jgi:hypothetical protein